MLFLPAVAVPAAAGRGRKNEPASLGPHKVIYKGLTPCEVVFHRNVLIDGKSECKAGPDREIGAIVGLSVGFPHRAIVEDVAPCGDSIALRT